MKKAFTISLFIIALVLFSCKNSKTEVRTVGTGESGTVQLISSDSFKKLIYNYEKNKEWKYEGSGPVIIDFYADWCPPCRQLSPLVEEVAKEYQGKISFYKINTDKERSLAQSLGITSLPTLLYIPADGKPQVTLGFIPKETIIKTIKEVLLTNNQ